jgi:hypothetical protein
MKSVPRSTNPEENISQTRRFFSGETPEKLAARLGLEPRQNESESFVLPLHHRAVKKNAPRVSSTKRWSRRWDSNPQPPVYKTGALPLSYAGGKLAALAGKTLKKLLAILTRTRPRLSRPPISLSNKTEAPRGSPPSLKLWRTAFAVTTILSNGTPNML